MDLALLGSQGTRGCLLSDPPACPAVCHGHGYRNDELKLQK